jgi:hypothetical protein
MAGSEHFAFTHSVTVQQSGNSTGPFTIPRGFTGHLYITGAPTQQVIFAIGSDEHGNIEAPRGFNMLIASSKAFETAFLISPTQDPPNAVRLRGLPAASQPVTVTFVGTAPDLPVAVAVGAYLEA